MRCISEKMKKEKKIVVISEITFYNLKCAITINKISKRFISSSDQPAKVERKVKPNNIKEITDQYNSIENRLYKHRCNKGIENANSALTSFTERYMLSVPR